MIPFATEITCPDCGKVSRVIFEQGEFDNNGNLVFTGRITACKHLESDLKNYVAGILNHAIPIHKPRPVPPFEAGKLRCDTACPLAPKCRTGQVPECVLPPWARELVDGLKEDADNYREKWHEKVSDFGRLAKAYKRAEKEALLDVIALILDKRRPPS